MAFRNNLKFKETEIGLIPGDWSVVNLEELFSIETGKGVLKEKRFNHGGYEIIGANGRIGFTDDYLIDGKYILTGRVGTLGEVNLVSGKIWPSDNVLIIGKRSNDANLNFLYYFLKTFDFTSLNVGSTQPLITQKALKNIKIALPSEMEQKQIAEILSSLDDKIELNKKINANLEEIAKAIFKKWFIDVGDELPDGWVIKKLSEIADITIGRTPPRLQKQWFSENSEDVKWISIRDLGNSGIYINKTAEYLTREAVNKFNIPVIPKNTVILSFKLTVGRVAITVEDMLSNEAIAHIKLNNDNISSEYIYLFLKRFDYSSLGSTSSIATAVNSKSIKDISVLIPDNESLRIFNEIVNPIFQNILENSNQIISLSQTRDTLLSRLMSGKIRVDNK